MIGENAFLRVREGKNSGLTLLAGVITKIPQGPCVCVSHSVHTLLLSDARAPAAGFGGI